MSSHQEYIVVTFVENPNSIVDNLIVDITDLRPKIGQF